MAISSRAYKPGERHPSQCDSSLNQATAAAPATKSMVRRRPDADTAPTLRSRRHWDDRPRPFRYVSPDCWAIARRETRSAESFQQAASTALGLLREYADGYGRGSWRAFIRQLTGGRLAPHAL